jgi:hypothetical protein
VRLHHFFEDNVNAYIILENCSRKVSLFGIIGHCNFSCPVQVRKLLDTKSIPQPKFTLKMVMAGRLVNAGRFVY